MCRVYDACVFVWLLSVIKKIRKAVFLSSSPALPVSINWSCFAQWCRWTALCIPSMLSTSANSAHAGWIGVHRCQHIGRACLQAMHFNCKTEKHSCPSQVFFGWGQHSYLHSGAQSSSTPPANFTVFFYVRIFAFNCTFVLTLTLSCHFIRNIWLKLTQQHNTGPINPAFMKVLMFSLCSVGDLTLHLFYYSFTCPLWYQ